MCPTGVVNWMGWIIGAKTNVSRWVVLLIDISLVLQTFFVAYVVRFNFNLSFQKFGFFSQIPLLAILAIISFTIVGSYKGTVRQTGSRDALNVFYGATILYGLMVLITLLTRNNNVLDRFAIPISTSTIHYLLNIVVCA